ncbi:MAG: hypothetical protein MUC98_17475 [Desulfobacterota bacterium]|nr:hypothetical protein [Thermodesulfobacteriota bacterium]
MRCALTTLALFLCALTALSCGPDRDLAGKYHASDPRGGQKKLLLELKEDGKGLWKMDHPEAGSMCARVLQRGRGEGAE